MIPKCRHCINWAYLRMINDPTCRLGYCRQCHKYGYVVRIPA